MKHAIELVRGVLAVVARDAGRAEVCESLIPRERVTFSIDWQRMDAGRMICSLRRRSPFSNGASSRLLGTEEESAGDSRVVMHVSNASESRSTRRSNSRRRSRKSSASRRASSSRKLLSHW